MFLSNIKNYLSDNNYNINIYKNNIYINNYLKLEHVSEKNVVVSFDKFKLIISGDNLIVVKMVDDEVLFNGHIESIKFKYETNN